MSTVVLSCLAFTIALIALFRAVADRLAYRRQIDSLYEKVKVAEGQLKKRAQLADEIAHEIKNPLTAIMCSAETLDLLIGNKLENLHRESLHYIKEYGEHLLRLVSDYLDVSRLESAQVKSKPKVVNVEESLKSVVGLLQSKSYAAQVLLRQTVDDPTLTAFIDPQHFKQIIFNLVHNALKFTRSGGEVHVNATAHPSSGFVSIIVDDDGCGIPPEELRHIFDPYVHKEQRNCIEIGTGLGLALCKSLVDLAGGTIAVKSWLGVGTIFEVLIPRGDLAQQDCTEEIDRARPEPNLQQSVNPLLGQTYLVCDSDPIARQSIARLIEAWGGLVDQAEEASMAVRALSERNYDAVMLESKISTDAIDLLNSIKAEMSDTQTRLILTCAEPIDRNSANINGADAVLEKPLSPPVLLRSLL